MQLSGNYNRKSGLHCSEPYGHVCTRHFQHQPKRAALHWRAHQTGVSHFNSSLANHLMAFRLSYKKDNLHFSDPTYFNVGFEEI